MKSEKRKQRHSQQNKQIKRIKAEAKADATAIYKDEQDNQD